MANLRKIGGNYYAYFYRQHKDPTRKSYPLRVQLKSTAKQELKRLEKALAEERFDPWKDDPWIGDPDVQPIPLRDAIGEFIEDKSTTVQPSTADTYRQQLEAWADLLPITYQVLDLEPKHIKEFVHDPAVANATRRKRYRHVHVFLGWCKKNLYLEENPIGDVQKPRKEKKETPVLTSGDVESLLETIDEHRASTKNAAGQRPDVQWLKDAIVIGMYTGLRRGELASLSWIDVDLKAETISVRNRKEFRTKTGDERTVPLRGPALSQVRDIRSRRTSVDRDTTMIQDRRGEPVRPDRMTSRFKHFARKAELDERVSFHTLRHSCASLLSAEGVPLRTVQKVLGHASITTTEKYSHLRDKVVGRQVEEAFDG